MDTTALKPSAVHTAGAVLIAVIIWLVVSTIVSALSFIIQNFMTVIRPEIIGFVSNIIGAVVGVTVAKVAVDRWMPRYSEKAVAVAIIVVSVVTLLLEWFWLVDPAHPIQVTAAGVTAILMAHHIFWKGMDL